MKTCRIRQICRAHNRFTPSIALWQQFVLPHRPLLRQQRLSSTASGPVASPQQNDENGVESPAGQQNDKSVEAEEPPTPVATLRFKRYDPKWPSMPVSEAKGRKVVQSSKPHSERIESQKKALEVAITALSTGGDYEAVVVKPALDIYSMPDETRLPWAVPITPNLEAKPMARFNREIAKFHQYSQPSQREALARKNIIEQARNFAYKVLPEYTLEVFGSERTGLAKATSDIDLRLTKCKPGTDEPSNRIPTMRERQENYKSLRRLNNKGSRKNADFVMTAIRHARYPLVSMQHRATGIDVQIVLANDTSVSRDMMNRYMQEYPQLAQVYAVVKAMFDTRGLSDVFHGGFGSYPIFMMIVASLRHTPKPPVDAAGTLVNFLKFWTRFDTSKHGVSIEPCELFDKTENPVMSETTKKRLLSGQNKPLPPFMLSLRDPADPTNDLGRKGVCIKHVQATCKALLARVMLELKVNPKTREKSPITFLKPIVGGVYTIDLPKRKKLQDEGEKLFAEMQKGFEGTMQRIEKEEVKIEEETNMALGLSQ